MSRITYFNELMPADAADAETLVFLVESLGLALNIANRNLLHGLASSANNFDVDELETVLSRVLMAISILDKHEIIQIDNVQKKCKDSLNHRNLRFL